MMLMVIPFSLMLFVSALSACSACSAVQSLLALMITIPASSRTIDDASDSSRHGAAMRDAAAVSELGTRL